MFERALFQFRRLVASGRYLVTLHCLEELEADGLTILDVEGCVMTGTIVERQKDRSNGEWKFVIQGWSTAGEECVVVVKWTPTGRLRVLTAFALDR